jgi:mono/diheme cytochrome c family protein
MMKKLALVALAAGCGTSTNPSPDPPDSWGVPISGGNVIVAREGHHAIVADPDRDRILTVNLDDGTSTEIPLQPGDEPGRLVEDGAGHFHVALRRGGALVTIADGAISARRAACAEPRGVAYEATTDLVHVACSTGELVSFPATGGDAVRSVRIDRDLRDVLVVNGKLYVTRFRAAELLALDANGAITSRTVPPVVRRFAGFNGGAPDAGTGSGSGSNDGKVDDVAAVAWRSIALPDGRILMSHQRQLKTILNVTHGGYGGEGCGEGPVGDSVTVIQPDGTAAPIAMAPFVNGALPVDVAVSPNGQKLSVVLAGAQGVRTISMGALVPDNGDSGCTGGGDDNEDLGAPTSAAYTPGNDLVVFYPEFPALVVSSVGTPRIIELPGTFGYDSGRGLFHRQTPSGLACASCHPEGRDDGLVWQFQDSGFRRTQNLAGSILSRAPYHWTGDQADLPTLMDDVFAVRMAGATPTRSEHRSLGPFLERVPAPAPTAAVDPDAAARGKAVFDAPEVGCNACHSGALMTTKAIVDVGTGGKFKVPSLVGIGARAPFLHNGCAATLKDRFDTYCGGGDLHGKTSTLTPQQLDDLVAYLETL